MPEAAPQGRPLALSIYRSSHIKIGQMTPQKLIIRTAGLVAAALEGTHWPLFFTLTYANPLDWSPRHISKFLQNYRQFIAQWSRGGKLTYIWTAQNNPSRPGIHYHGIMWIPYGCYPPKPDVQGWWPYGWTNVQKARNPAGYIARYIISDDSDLVLPRRARRYSISVKSVLSLDFLKCPGWMCYFSQYGDVIRRVPGHGWVNFRTMLSYDSPYDWSGDILKWRGWREVRNMQEHGRCGVPVTLFELGLVCVPK